MPFVHIRIAGREIAQAEVQHLQTEATQLLARILRKKADLTAVLVERMEAATWSVGGRIVRVAGHLDVKVTAGTNTAEEKARFIAAAHGLLKDMLGHDLPVATYVIVDEIAADAWGYDGLTQEARWPTVPQVDRDPGGDGRDTSLPGYFVR